MPVSFAEKRNVVLLAASQALFQTISVLIMTVGGLAGYLLAADKALATLPISAMSVGTAIATIAALLLMARIGGLSQSFSAHDLQRNSALPSLFRRNHRWKFGYLKARSITTS